MALKSNLKEILAEDGIKQKHIAEKIGMTTTQFSKIARGESIPTLENGIRIAKIVKRKVEEIWEVES